MYGVPKDKDTVCLVYNKEMFDAAGVAYPDETWTWDTLCDASAQIHDKTGICKVILVWTPGFLLKIDIEFHTLFRCRICKAGLGFILIRITVCWQM